ncbi:MAG: tRNA 2-thiouridine(34) synthase MnmA, partial [bacterium]|nr:tRNA 2-thiouridine(34) synthase MnmA [bacterium]
GHYAKIRYDRRKKTYDLVKAKDPKKDQSYFLYTLTQDQLKYILFPLGEYTKPEVRILAQKIGLPTAHRQESQEICFIPDNDYRRFLKERIGRGIRKGSITDTAGKRLGIHQGLPFYTIGQRKGLGIAAAHPLYVQEINHRKNILVVAPESGIYRKKLIASKIIWTSLKKLTTPLKVQAKIRSAHKAADCTIALLGKNKIKAEFSAGQWAITPGQAIVFYQGKKIIGGGTILKAVDS